MTGGDQHRLRLFGEDRAEDQIGLADRQTHDRGVHLTGPHRAERIGQRDLHGRRFRAGVAVPEGGDGRRDPLIGGLMSRSYAPLTSHRDAPLVRHRYARSHVTDEPHR
ncbi:hypothetical protein TPA0910_58040 [Streptomyces hygroscopicus subsp. sporocinereus]|uniref:Uncharacterized protein n=1 Tax=Streptomyces hygroscopicus TaxID=1912 RepID=A0ABQ3U823_STRHY|nr:hypothetical protein TPA0910_58040 [Streptomyces hygroscopicus]